VKFVLAFVSILPLAFADIAGVKSSFLWGIGDIPVQGKHACFYPEADISPAPCGDELNR